SGCPDLPERCSIGITEMVDVSHRYRAMIIWRGLGHGELAGLATQFGAVARRFIFPGALLGRHKADAIGPVAVIETIGFDRLFARRELGGHGHVNKRIAIARPGARQIKDVPLYNL